MNALDNAEVGKYLNEFFGSSFQKVATFKIVGNQKQGGKFDSYFCAPGGRVRHAIAGPVDAATMLREAKWVVENTEKAMKEAKGDGAAFKAYFRKAHADRLRAEAGLIVEPVTYDPVVEQDPKAALTYNDPSGRRLAPKLPPPPIDGPDVTLKDALKEKQDAAGKAPGAREVMDRKGGRWQLGNQGRVDMLLAAHAMDKIENLYGTVFQEILNEKISTKPVEVLTPFPWVKEKN